jgi:hypothetical protein
VPGIEPTPEAAAHVPSIDDYKAAADKAPPARTADDEAVLAAGDDYYGRNAVKPAPEPEWFESRGQAEAAAFARGLGAFTVRKTDDEVYVIVVDADPQCFRSEPKARKSREPAAPKRAREPRARKSREPAAPVPPAPAKARHAGPGKFAATRVAAERGELPPVPDFSADLHKRNRGRLAQLVAMAEAGDVAGLEAFPIKPNCTSPRAMDRYRNLCVIALKARATAANSDVILRLLAPPS